MFICFQCAILQNAGQNVQVTEVNVIEKLKFVPPPTSKGLEIGSPGKIHCKVQGTPTPQIQWTKVKNSFLSTLDCVIKSHQAHSSAF